MTHWRADEPEIAGPSARQRANLAEARHVRADASRTQPPHRGLALTSKRTGLEHSSDEARRITQVAPHHSHYLIAQPVQPFLASLLGCEVAPPIDAVILHQPVELDDHGPIDEQVDAPDQLSCTADLDLTGNREPGIDKDDPGPALTRRLAVLVSRQDGPKRCAR